MLTFALFEGACGKKGGHSTKSCLELRVLGGLSGLSG